MGAQVKPLKPGWCEKSKNWTALPRMRLPKEEGLRLVLPRHGPLLCPSCSKLQYHTDLWDFFWKVTVCVCIKITTTTASVFRWCLQTLWEQQVQKQARERTSQALGTFPPFPGRRRDFSKLSLRAELLSAGERVTLYISMTSEWLSLLYTLISRDTDL